MDFKQLLDRFEDRAGNYFQDEPGVKAGIQMQKDAWNDAINALRNLIKDKNQNTRGGILLTNEQDFDSLKIYKNTETFV